MALPWHAWPARAAVERGWLDRGGWVAAERQRLRMQMIVFGAAIGLIIAAGFFSFQRIADSYWPLVVLVVICASVPTYFSYSSRRAMTTIQTRLYLSDGTCISILSERGDYL